MPLFTLFAAAGARAYGMMQSAKTALVDLFGRTTSGSLGGFWSALRGTWYANGSQAQSDDAAGNYPMAVASLSSNNMTVSASVGGGTGVGFWVSDANNWWAAAYTNSSSSYSCNCQTCTSYCCNSCTITSCGSCGSYYSCSYGYVCQGTKCCVGGGSVIGNATQYCNSCTVTSCASCGSYACGSYSCNCSTCTDYYHYLRLLKSVSGTVTTSVVSDVSLGQAAAAVKVTTNNDTIVATAYSDTSMVYSLGSINTTQSSPTKAPKAGIIKVPSNYTQSSTVDNFAAEG
jgi:hypothetical protein